MSTSTRVRPRYLGHLTDPQGINTELKFSKLLNDPRRKFYRTKYFVWRTQQVLFALHQGEQTIYLFTNPHKYITLYNKSKDVPREIVHENL